MISMVPMITKSTRGWETGDTLAIQEVMEVCVGGVERLVRGRRGRRRAREEVRMGGARVVREMLQIKGKGQG